MYDPEKGEPDPPECSLIPKVGDNFVDIDGEEFEIARYLGTTEDSGHEIEDLAGKAHVIKWVPAYPDEGVDSTPGEWREE